MSLVSRLSSLFHNLVHRDRVDRDLDEELQGYADALIDRRIREGMPADRARQVALAEIGGVQQVKEQVRADRSGAWFERLSQQLRYALRAMARRPGMSALLVVTTGLGLGAATAVFTVVDAALLRPPPFRNASELIELWTRDPQGRTYPRLDAERAEAWTNQPTLFARTERYALKTMLLGGADEPREARVALVSPGMFAMLGVRPVSGRDFGVADTRTGGPAVAIVSQTYWRLHGFDSIPRDAARIRLDEHEYPVVGAMPASFTFPTATVAIWLPLGDDATARTPAVNLVARLRPPVSEKAVQARFDAVSRQIANAAPRKEGWAAAPHFLAAPVIDAGGQLALWVLAGAVLCMLFVACVNAANLLLVHGLQRQREIGVRLALGATRTRLVADLLLENVALAAIAAAAGIAIAYLSVSAIRGLAPAGFTEIANGPVGVDGRVLAFAVTLTLVVWLICSAAPAVQAISTRESLAWGARGASAGRAMKRIRNAFVITELALSVALMAGAGLFARSLQRLTAVSPGFDVAHVLFADLGMSAGPSRSPEERAALLEAIAREVRAAPAVRAVSFATGLPPNSPTTPSSSIEGEDGATVTNGGDLAFTEADTAFFSTLGVPIVRGRAFRVEDAAPGVSNVVISMPLARALWSGGDPIGRRLRLAPDEPWRTVVGVAGDLKLVGPDDRASPYAVYYPRPVLGRATRIVSMAIRTSGEPRSVMTAIRAAIHRASATQPVSRLEPAAVAFAAATLRPRFVGALMACFALIAVILAASGVYGVFSYAVTQRTREIGIRMALGASRANVTATLLREGLVLTATGLAIGLAGVVASRRAIASLLFGVSPNDPLTLAVVALALVTVSLAATLVPTLKASRISPLVAISLE